MMLSINILQVLRINWVGDTMRKKKEEEEKVGFDLSTLSLQELITVYKDITDFMQYLDDNKIIVEEEKETEDD